MSKVICKEALYLMSIAMNETVLVSKWLEGERPNLWEKTVELAVHHILGNIIRGYSYANEMHPLSTNNLKMLLDDCVVSGMHELDVFTPYAYESVIASEMDSEDAMKMFEVVSKTTREFYDDYHALCDAWAKGNLSPDKYEEIRKNGFNQDTILYLPTTRVGNKFNIKEKLS